MSIQFLSPAGRSAQMPAAFCCDGHANRYAMAAKSAERLLNRPKFINKNTATHAPGSRKVLVSWSVPIRGMVLAPFDPPVHGVVPFDFWSGPFCEKLCVISTAT
jgi:hypothetical protein